MAGLIRQLQTTSSFSEMHNLVPQRGANGFSPVAPIQFHKPSLEPELYRRLRQPKYVRNLFAAATAHQEFQDLHFSGAQKRRVVVPTIHSKEGLAIMHSASVPICHLVWTSLGNPISARSG